MDIPVKESTNMPFGKYLMRIATSFWWIYRIINHFRRETVVVCLVVCIFFPFPYLLIWLLNYSYGLGRKKVSHGVLFVLFLELFIVLTSLLPIYFLEKKLFFSFFCSLIHYRKTDKWRRYQKSTCLSLSGVYGHRSWIEI